MESNVYEKGRRLLEANAVRLTDVTRRAHYFVVRGDTEDHFVRLMSDNTFNCTCMFGTLHGASKGALCSHVVAALLSLTDEHAKAEALARGAEASGLAAAGTA